MRQAIFPFFYEESEPQKEELPYGRVRDTSWDYRDIQAGSGVYGIHPYPAMFHFLVVRRLLNAFSAEGDLVLDPFMGSGVVAVECLINNRNFVGYDINPLAVLIAKVRSTPIPASYLLEMLRFIEINYEKVEAEEVDFPNINYWFDKEVISALSKLRKSIREISDEDARDFFLVSFSETVRKASKADYNEFKLLRRKDVSNANVLNIFKSISLRNIGLLDGFYREPLAHKPKITLKSKNIFEADISEESVDLVITSPPYGDSRTTVAYGQFSRLSLYWLGLEERVDRESLGSKARDITDDLPSPLLYEVLERIKEKDQKRAREVFAFYWDLFHSINILARAVKKNRFVCFVVGNRKVKGEELPTDKISADFFQSLGFKHLRTIVRAISNKRMPAENAPSNIKGERDFTMRQEYIVILVKE
ncbi:site-specific DNA-methyltransferase [bacterium]|nr:site-specific DNA-methyltransferase [bacterium]